MKTIFVVDDEEITLKTAEFILQQDGYDVVKCLSGMACLESLKEVLPDLILLDVEMPIMSGIQTLDVIRSNEEFKKIPVMFLTGSTDSETVAAACSLGAIDYVIKPFFPQDLLDRVKKILRF
ncbi:MAG: response regulator [Lachnospiraceae bacterium]|nr:response regulator [Lachnospiraceae bacterium]